MKLFTTSIGAIVIAATVSTGAYVSVNPHHYFSFGGTTTDNAYVRGDVTPISPKIAGYVTEVAVRDNQQVKSGDILFRIDDADYEARVALAGAGLKAKQAAIGNLDSRLELQKAMIGRAEATLQGATADADRATKQYTRSAGLAKDRTVSQASLDQAQSDSLRADAKVAESKANLLSAKVQMSVLESQRPQLLADIDAAAATLRLAQIDLDSTVVKSPEDGWVGERQARAGQYVKPGSMLIAFVAKTVWIVANYKESQLSELRIGEKVSVQVDGVPSVLFSGTLDSFSPASGAQFALLPPDNATGNFTRIAQRIPVRISLDVGQEGIDQLRPGMSASVSTSGDDVPAT